jgi:glucan 1,3-beta-glucosidase
MTGSAQILSQLTSRIRLYGANCNATAMVLQAIQDTKVNMTIWPAIYIDSNEAAYTTQLAAVKSALETYGTDHIEGVSFS